MDRRAAQTPHLLALLMHGLAGAQGPAPRFEDFLVITGREAAQAPVAVAVPSDPAAAAMARFNKYAAMTIRSGGKLHPERPVLRSDLKH